MTAKNYIIVLILLIVSIGLTNARADSVTVKEFTTETVPAVVNGTKELPAKTKNFLTKEVAKTKEYQKKSWAEAKEQNAKLVNGIKKFFTGLNKEAVK